MLNLCLLLQQARRLLPLQHHLDLHVRKYAAEPGVSGQEALQMGMKAKNRDLTEQGSELDAKG